MRLRSFEPGRARVKSLRDETRTAGTYLPTKRGGTYLRKWGVPTYENEGYLPTKMVGTYLQKGGVPTYENGGYLPTYENGGYLPTKMGGTYLRK